MMHPDVSMLQEWKISSARPGRSVRAQASGEGGCGGRAEGEGTERGREERRGKTQPHL